MTFPRGHLMIGGLLAASLMMLAPNNVFGEFSLTLASGSSSYTVEENPNPTYYATGTPPSTYVDTAGALGQLTVTSVANHFQQGGALNGFTFNITGSTNSPGTASKGEVIDSTITITNTSTSLNTITLTFFSDGFTLPGQVGDNVNLISSLSYQKGPVLGDGGSYSFTSTITDGGGSATTTPVSTNDGTAQASFSRSTDSFSLTNTVTLTIAAGGTFEFQANTDVVSPAPGSAMLALAGAPMLGLFAFRYRRRDSLPLQASIA